MPVPVAARARLDALDGLRGIAIVLVVLSHGWTLWPTTFITEDTWSATLFRSGDSAVTIFLVASGFLLFRSIAASTEHTQMQPLLVAVRRVIRVGPAMWLVLLAVMVVAVVDPTDKATATTNRDSVLHALTYTYNWLVQNNLTGTRADLGHLWYVSVDMQAVVIVSVIAFLLRRRPTWLLGFLAVLFVLLVLWRFHSYGVENIFIVLNRTTARMDAFVLGALAAAVVPLLPRADGAYRVGAPVALVLTLPVLYWCRNDSSYLQLGGTVLELLVAAFVVCAAMTPSRSSDLLGNRVLVTLGRMSLVIYLWHFPIFHFVSRHTNDWPWVWRALVAFLATAAISWATQVVLERRISRLLARPEWQALRAGTWRPWDRRRHRVPTEG
ncbi:MAG: acyltransferase [Propionibacteriaceae bacterium]